MLTQFQIIERQAALLAACPRPRTLALSGMNTVGKNGSGINTTGTQAMGMTLSASTVFASTVPASTVTTLSAPSVPSVRSHSALISVGAGVRASGLGVAERPATSGYADASLPVPMAAVRPDFATFATEGNGSNNGTQQDKQYLTARRGPVTWRPPH